MIGVEEKNELRKFEKRGVENDGFKKELEEGRNVRVKKMFKKGLRKI